MKDWRERMAAIDRRYMEEWAQHNAAPVAIDASCMLCGEHRPCNRNADIGWICSECRNARVIH